MTERRERMFGTINYFNERGFGFIRMSEDAEDLYFHVSSTREMKQTLSRAQKQSSSLEFSRESLVRGTSGCCPKTAATTTTVRNDGRTTRTNSPKLAADQGERM